VLIVGSRMKSGSEFHAIGPATKNARRPYVLSRKRGTTSRWRLAECRFRRVLALETGMQCSDRYGGARPFRHWWTVTASLKRPGQARRASAVGRAVSDPGRDQTSECRWYRVQQSSTPAVICPLLFLVHRPGQCQTRVKNYVGFVSHVTKQSLTQFGNIGR